MTPARRFKLFCFVSLLVVGGAASSLAREEGRGAATRAQAVPGGVLDLRSGHIDGDRSRLVDGSTSTSITGTSREAMTVFVLVPYRMGVEQVEVYVPGGGIPSLAVWAGDTTGDMKSVSAAVAAQPGAWNAIAVPPSEGDGLVFAIMLTAPNGAMNLKIAEVRLTASKYQQARQYRSYDAVLQTFLDMGKKKTPKIESWNGSLGVQLASIRGHFADNPEDKVRFFSDLCDLLPEACENIDGGRKGVGQAPRALNKDAQKAKTSLHGFLLSVARKVYSGISGFDPKEKNFKKMVKARTVAIGIRDGGTGDLRSFYMDEANSAERDIDSSCWFVKVADAPECWGLDVIARRDPIAAFAYRLALKGLEAIDEFGLLEELKDPRAVARNDNLGVEEGCFGPTGMDGYWEGDFFETPGSWGLNGFPFGITLATTGNRFAGSWNLGNNHTFRVEGKLSGNRTISMKTWDTLPVPPFAAECLSTVRSTTMVRGTRGCQSATGTAKIKVRSDPLCWGNRSSTATMIMRRPE